MYKNQIMKYLSISTVCVILFLVIQILVHASGNFYHKHTSACMSTRTITCDYEHVRNVYAENVTRHCNNCAAQTEQFHYVTNYNCYATGVYQVVAGNYFCRSCHVYIGSWGSDSFSHTRTEEYASCGISESATVARVSIASSDINITNKDVTLTASTTILNSSGITNNFSYSWAGQSGASKTVGENGTYTVTVTNTNGTTATASIQVTNIDKVPPTINSITHRTQGMTSTSITIDVVGSDDKGEVSYSSDGGASWKSSGDFVISSGNSYSIGVKDLAGNTTFKTVNRSDFPYPEVVPSPSPSPSPSPTPETTPSLTPENVTTTVPTIIPTPSVSEKEDKEEVVQKTEDKFVQAGGVELENEEFYELTQEQKDAISKYEEMNRLLGIYPDRENGKSGILVPVINMIKYAEIEAQHNQVQENISLAELDETKGMDDKEVTQERNLFEEHILAVIAIAVFAIGGCIGGYLFFSSKTAVLYSIEVNQNQTAFRKIKHVGVQKQQGIFFIHLPENLAETTQNSNFRIFLNKYFIEHNEKGKIKICVGDRRLVADLEECIDFTL